MFRFARGHISEVHLNPSNAVGVRRPKYISNHKILYWNLENSKLAMRIICKVHNNYDFVWLILSKNCVGS